MAKYWKNQIKEIVPDVEIPDEQQEQLSKTKRIKRITGKELLYRVTHQDPRPSFPILFIQVFFTVVFLIAWYLIKFVFELISIIAATTSVAAIAGVRMAQSISIHLDIFKTVSFYAWLLLAVLFIFYLFLNKKVLFLMGATSIATLIIAANVYEKYYPVYDEYNTYALSVAQKSSSDDFMINESSTIFDVHNKTIGTLKENADMTYLKYDDIPENVINAFVAVEDQSFWENDGADYYGMMTVIYEYLKSKGEDERGASTITQQLVRNKYLSSEKNIERKIKEILIARHLTQMYSKEQIMEYYVNDICYANGIYGIAGAARAYFNKDVKDLSLAQIAYLCAIPNRPSYYDPYKNAENAISRQHKILKDMAACGYISTEQYQHALAETIRLKPPKEVFNDYLTTFATDCAIKYLLLQDDFEFKYEFQDREDYVTYHDAYNEAYENARHKLCTGGYKVYTTLDMDVYDKLQAILDENLAFNEEINPVTDTYALQGAATVIDNQTGKVVAVVGGRKQETMTYSFNRAYQSFRQPGSSFKPIAVYTPAIMKGFRPETMVENIDVTAAKEKDVVVQNLHGERMTLRSAVEKSKNGVAWKIFDFITPQYGMSFPVSMHYSNLCPDDYFNASSLGGLTYGVTTVEQASGYATLANHGVYRYPTCISSMLDKNGKEIFEEYPQEEIYNSFAADTMVDILKGVITHGTAAGLSWYSKTKTEAFAKTGTTNSSKDGWLCGVTPYYTIAVWVGFDIPKQLNNLYGATYPGKIWRDMMYSMIEGAEPAIFVSKPKDESAASFEEQATGYYSYLAGRSDSEVLSDNYTVADYRTDRVIGESVDEVISKINFIDMSSSDSNAKLDELYQSGLNIINTIYSTKYSSEMTEKLNDAYRQKKQCE
ncbi:MAG: penicillin-binding protein [Butyrivibrio sp.]|nr:penicillin-binding protein [Butyrivibrio sp.]